MQHNILPLDKSKLQIDVRHFGEDSIHYDGLGFASFPFRRGFPLDHLGRVSIQHLHQQRPGKEANFIQAWLFMGLIQEYFGDIYVLEDFIVKSEGTALGLKHVDRLQKMLKIKQSELLQLKAQDIESADREQARLNRLIHHAAHFCAELDHPLDGEIINPAWGTTLLSIKLLIQTLDTELHLDLQLHKPVDVKAPSLVCLKDAMLKAGGGCYHHVEELSSANTYSALFYLASMRRYPDPWIDHSLCDTKDQCTAYNVNEKTHRTLHVEEGCECPPVKAPETNLEIIRSGKIPFARCERMKGELPKITHAVVRPGIKYTAISHIWSDGLGNILANELPQCQLERILDRIEALHFKVNSRSSSSVIRAVQNKYRCLREKVFGPSPVCINFWMDVFCNRVVPPGCDAVRAADLKRILATGISRLLPTYILAEYVLILDHEVRKATLSQSNTELLCRLAVSGWCSRCWTHQEYCFSKIQVFQCADGLGPMLRDEQATKAKPTNMEESIEFELQNLAPITLHASSGIENPSQSLPGLGFTSTSTQDLEQQRSVRFIHVWNQLSKKNITHNYDSLEILANLLELRAGDLLDQSTRNQMKAVLGSHNRLPLALPFSSTKRYTDLDEDRWIPLYPTGGEPLREESLQVDLTQSGLVIASDYFDSHDANGVDAGKSHCSIMAVEALSIHGYRWIMEIPNAKIEAEKKIWVSLQPAREQQNFLVPNNSSVIFILDTSPSVLHTTIQRGRRGFCLMKQECRTTQHQALAIMYARFFGVLLQAAKIKKAISRKGHY